jgi:aquaporin Z
LHATEHQLPRPVNLATIPPTSSADLTTPGRLFRDRRALPRPEPGAALVDEAELSWPETLRRHWPEYAIEGGFLATFLLGTGVVSAWLLSPSGPGAAALPDLAVRHLLAGLAMGLALMAMIYSPWGRRSGTHLNPAITLAYLRLGKFGRWDALFYVLAQVAGGVVAVTLLRGGVPLFAMAQPALLLSTGPTNDWAVFLTEFVLSGTAMLLILFTSNHASWFRWTGVLYGLLVAVVVACAAPLSGFGMNVARLLAVDASADPASANWLNLLPPLLGMQLAVEAYRRLTGRSQVLCAKLAHNTHGRCIFRCQHPYQIRALALEAIQRRASGARH